jgi:tetratricopeptide (TPR) repeat protein
MFCHHCGLKLPDEANFCFKCGAATATDVAVEIIAESQAIARQTYNGEAVLAPEAEAQEIPTDEQIRQLIHEASDKAFLEHNIRGGLQLCEQALKLDKHNSEIYLTIGNILVESRRYEEAIAAFDQAIKLGNPLTADYNVKARALADKGGALFQLDRYEEVLNAVDEAIRLDPLRWQPYHLKSTTLTLLGGHLKESKEARQQAEVLRKRENEARERKLKELRRRRAEG